MGRLDTISVAKKDEHMTLQKSNKNRKQANLDIVWWWRDPCDAHGGQWQRPFAPWPPVPFTWISIMRFGAMALAALLSIVSMAV